MSISYKHYYKLIIDNENTFISQNYFATLSSIIDNSNSQELMLILI